MKKILFEWNQLGFNPSESVMSYGEDNEMDYSSDIVMSIKGYKNDQIIGLNETMIIPIEINSSFDEAVKFLFKLNQLMYNLLNSEIKEKLLIRDEKVFLKKFLKSSQLLLKFCMNKRSITYLKKIENLNLKTSELISIFSNYEEFLKNNKEKDSVNNIKKAVEIMMNYETD